MRQEGSAKGRQVDERKRSKKGRRMIEGLQAPPSSSSLYSTIGWRGGGDGGGGDNEEYENDSSGGITEYNR